MTETHSTPPADAVTMPDMAQRMGVKLHTVHVMRHKGKLPEPDGVFAFGGARTPWWHLETFTAWMASRPRAGRKAVSGE